MRFSRPLFGVSRGCPFWGQFKPLVTSGYDVCGKRQKETARCRFCAGPSLFVYGNAWTDMVRSAQEGAVRRRNLSSLYLFFIFFTLAGYTKSCQKGGNKTI